MVSGKTLGKTSGKTSVKIIEFIKNNSNITIPELAEKLSKTTRAIEISIFKLKEDGNLKRIGSAKGGHWEVNE